MKLVALKGHAQSRVTVRPTSPLQQTFRCSFTKKFYQRFIKIKQAFPENLTPLWWYSSD